MLRTSPFHWDAATEPMRLANLMAHTVREHTDGTISVLPGDGSSNSILVTRRPGETWHGYVRDGVLEGDGP